MKGYVEESPEVKARRALHEAAREYVSKSLVSFNSDAEQGALENAALAYAEAIRPRRRRADSAPHTKENG